MKKIRYIFTDINPDFFICSVVRFMILLNIIQLAAGLLFMKEGYAPSLMKCLVIPLGISAIFGYIGAVRIGKRG